MTTGIYLIRHLGTGKCYIGSALNIQRRWLRHQTELRNRKHCNQHLQRAWNKYGERDFYFHVLEECKKERLLELEQSYIDALNPEYNICKVAGRVDGRVVSDITRKKMSDAQKGIPKKRESVEKQRLKMIGRKLSPEHKEKVRLTSTGRRHSPEAIEKIKKYHNLPETKEKIHNALFGKKKSPETIEKMKLSQQNRSVETRKKLSIANSGKKQSKESIMKRTQTRLLNNGGVYTSRSKSQDE